MVFGARRRGFGLVELVIVFAIGAIISGAAFASFSSGWWYGGSSAGAKPVVWRDGSARRCSKAIKMAKVLPSTLRREPWKTGYASRGEVGMAILCPTEKGIGGGSASAPVISSPGEGPWRYRILFSVEPCLSPVSPWRYVTAVGCRILPIATSLFLPMPTSLCLPLLPPDGSCPVSVFALGG